MLILYGSETGTAEDVAVELSEDARRLGDRVRLTPMNAVVDLATLLEWRLVVFVCSTTGQGDEPTNMRRFWRTLLRRDLPARFLVGIHCAVLGLGDSSYEKFNFVAKRLYRRLEQLGAELILPVGLANEQDELGLSAVVDVWRNSLWLEAERLMLVPSRLNCEAAALPPRYTVVFDDAPSTELDVNDGVFVGELVQNDRVTAAEHFQDTRLIGIHVLDDEGTRFRYGVGDVLVVKPRNLRESVDAFLRVISGGDFDRVFRLDETASTGIETVDDETSAKHYTLRSLVECVFDLQCVPRRSFFKRLAMFAENASVEHERLVELASPEGQDELAAYCFRPRRTLFEVALDFASTMRRVPLASLVELMPRIRARSFSIASNFEVHGRVVQLLVAVVRYRTRLAKPRVGLCSTWLTSEVPLGTRLRFSIEKGTFVGLERLAALPTPCVLVGPGTGVAPFRNLMYARVRYAEAPNVLFFGSRHPERDFYFENEWRQMVHDGRLTLICAFSRETPSKVYVQHRIVERGELVVRRLVDEQGVLLIAGNAKEMPQAVKSAVREALQKYAGMSEDEAEDYVKMMERERRLQMECWS